MRFFEGTFFTRRVPSLVVVETQSCFNIFFFEIPLKIFNLVPLSYFEVEVINYSQIIYSASTFPSAIITTVPFEKYYKLNSMCYGIKNQPSPEFLT